MRARIGLHAAGLLALIGLIVFYSSDPSIRQPVRDPYLVEAQADRLAGVRDVLPPGAAVVDYVSDAAPGSTLDSALFDSAQYTLAPLLIERGRGDDWVLGDFSTPPGMRAALADSSLRAVRDLGNGVVVFRRVGR